MNTFVYMGMDRYVVKIVLSYNFSYFHPGITGITPSCISHLWYYISCLLCAQIDRLKPYSRYVCGIR